MFNPYISDETASVCFSFFCVQALWIDLAPELECRCIDCFLYHHLDDLELVLLQPIHLNRRKARRQYGSWNPVANTVNVFLTDSIIAVLQSRVSAPAIRSDGSPALPTALSRCSLQLAARRSAVQPALGAEPQPVLAYPPSWRLIAFRMPEQSSVRRRGGTQSPSAGHRTLKQNHISGVRPPEG
jgi:hypothetical protein